MFYDPMIAKLCTWAVGDGKAARAAAINGMQDALDGFELEGIGHNIPFLQAVMNHDLFRSGDISTAFIAEEYPEGFEGASLGEAEIERAAALATVAHVISESRNVQISGTLSNHAQEVGTKWIAMIDDPVAGKSSHGVSALWVEGAAEVSLEGGERWRVETDWTPGQALMTATIDGEPTVMKLSPLADGWRVRWRGADLKIAVRSPRAAELAALMPIKLPPDTSKFLLCPMPGLVVNINVEEGEEVQEGQALATVEAMKMENVLRAERKGVVAAVKAAPGDSLAVDEIIIEFA